MQMDTVQAQKDSSTVLACTGLTDPQAPISIHQDPCIRHTLNGVLGHKVWEYTGYKQIFTFTETTFFSVFLERKKRKWYLFLYR